MELINKKILQNNIKSTIVTYVILLGICYLMGYWQSFNINIFNYIGIWDIVKFSASSLIACSLSYIIAFFIVWLFFENRDNIEKICANLIVKLVLYIVLGFSILFFLAILCAVICNFITHRYIFNFNLSFLRAIFAYVFLFISPYALNMTLEKFNLIGNRIIRLLLCTFFGTFPALAYINGLMDAVYILKQRDYLYTYCNSITEEKSCKYLKYVGTVNNKLFFIDQDNNKITIKDFDKVSDLTLIHFQKK